jgi:hypothetical protein
MIDSIFQPGFLDNSHGHIEREAIPEKFEQSGRGISGG